MRQILILLLGLFCCTASWAQSQTRAAEVAGQQLLAALEEAQYNWNASSVTETPPDSIILTFLLQELNRLHKMSSGAANRAVETVEGLLYAPQAIRNVGDALQSDLAELNFLCVTGDCSKSSRFAAVMQAVAAAIYEDYSDLVVRAAAGEEEAIGALAFEAALFLLPFDEVRYPVKALFRGTSEGFVGGSATRALGITSTSTDPVVATVFALEGKNFGKGVVHVASTDDLKHVKVAEVKSNVRGKLEKEIGLEILPEDLAKKSGITITADEARKILKDMGIDLPNEIRNPSHGTQVLEETPRLTPSQIETFIHEARKLSNH